MLTEGDTQEGGGAQETASSLSQLSTQTVFSMVSHLTQWSRHILYSKPKVNGNVGVLERISGTSSFDNKKLHLKKFTFAESGDFQRVVAFLKGIPQDVLAKASLRSKAYTRALMHFEAYILENKLSIQDHLSFLQVKFLLCISFGFREVIVSECSAAVADAVRCHARTRRSEGRQRFEEGGAVATGTDTRAREHRPAPRRDGLLRPSHTAGV